MLMSWVVRNADDASNPKDGINKEDFRKANEELGLSARDFWVLQLRHEWLAMGLPTDQAEALLRAWYAVDDNGGLVGLRGELRSATFTSALDREKLARSLFPGGPNRRYLHIVNGGAFRLTCRFKVEPRVKSLETYYPLAYKAYELETSGMPDEEHGSSTAITPRVDA
jgi:hypothetical protein